MTDLSVGRLILPALRWADATGFDHERPAIEAALDAGAGGFIVFGGPAERVRTLTRDLTARAGRPLIFGADLERGAGQQFAGLTELPPPLALASLEDAEAVRRAGEITARDARSVGINWVFAPVADLDLLADNPIVQTRSFGADPGLVADCVRAWIAGCHAGGAAACVKHYPGHGRTSTDSHAGLPVVEVDATTLHATDLVPFNAAIGAGVEGVMTAHVAFPSLDPSGRPATMSDATTSLLRGEGQFDGVIVTDALIMEGAFVGRTEADVYAGAISAGVDLLLYPKSIAGARDALAAALDSGRLSPARAREALGRQEALLNRVAGMGTPPAERPSQAFADRLVERGLVRGSIASLREPVELVNIDDDVGGPYPASPGDWCARALDAAGVRLGPGGSRIVLALAEPRAWKGRGGFGKGSLDRLAAESPSADLVVLFAHPRLAADVPGSAPMLLAWHRQRPMQEAVARLLVRLVRR